MTEQLHLHIEALRLARERHGDARIAHAKSQDDLESALMAMQEAERAVKKEIERITGRRSDFSTVWADYLS